MIGALKTCLLVSVVILGVITGGGFLIFGWDSPDCGKDSEAVRFARSLSAERLEKLYFDFALLSKKSDVSEVYSSYGEGEKLPPEFSDLEVVKLRPKKGYILVQGCMDHGVTLEFDGLKNSAKKTITLYWGEASPDSGQEVIWVQQ